MEHVYPLVLRRGERKITESQHLKTLLDTALVGRVGVMAQGEPYIVPMNSAYEQQEGTLGRIILHGAGQGRLFQALEVHPWVCFEIDTFIKTLPHPVLCEYDTAYMSVLCWGQVQRLMTVKEQTAALRLFAHKYASIEKAQALKERTVERFRSDMGAQRAPTMPLSSSVTVGAKSMDSKPSSAPTQRAALLCSLQARENRPAPATPVLRSKP